MDLNFSFSTFIILGSMRHTSVNFRNLMDQLYLFDSLLTFKSGSYDFATCVCTFNLCFSWPTNGVVC